VLADEGVFGLARAFRVAGARNVVMSLWQVDDAATAELMRHFYRELLATPATVPAALAAAAREVRDDRRASSLGSHPYYWAAFVSTGRAR
jgi:CHAT domain-containing protein